VVIARQMHQLLEGSRLVQNHDVIAGRLYQAWEQHQSAHREDTVFKSDIYLQSAYSLRCIPQILGPVLDTLQFCRQIVEAEVNSCNDNPLLFDTPEATFHGGNFHGQYVAMACDFLNIAVIEIGVLAERQLNRLLDPHLNGDLPPYLAAGQVGLQSGFEGAQYLATSLAAENLSLAAPSSVLSISSNGSNQDVVSMGLIAARKTLQLCENTATILATLVAACHQAYYFLDGAKFSPQVKTLHHQLATVAECYQDDVPIHALIHQVRTFLLERPGHSLVHGCVGFCSDSQGI
jgi:histidine ammonia-lyase/tyrosine ammonia-lyase